MATESLTLKWGTLKAWHLQGEESIDLLRKYFEGSVSASCMRQHDTPEQQALICEMIAAVDGPIYNDWSGETMTKDEAKKYVTEYRN